MLEVAAGGDAAEPGALGDLGGAERRAGLAQRARDEVERLAAEALGSGIAVLERSSPSIASISSCSASPRRSARAVRA